MNVCMRYLVKHDSRTIRASARACALGWRGWGRTPPDGRLAKPCNNAHGYVCTMSPAGFRHGNPSRRRPSSWVRQPVACPYVLTHTPACPIVRVHTHKHTDARRHAMTILAIVGIWFLVSGAFLLGAAWGSHAIEPTIE